jgi:hypothetical protein
MGKMSVKHEEEGCRTLNNVGGARSEWDQGEKAPLEFASATLLPQEKQQDV